MFRPTPVKLKAAVFWVSASHKISQKLTIGRFSLKAFGLKLYLTHVLVFLSFMHIYMLSDARDDNAMWRPALHGANGVRIEPSGLRTARVFIDGIH